MTPVTRLFNDHPASVGETYFGHMRFALWFAFWLGVAALAALVHALLPFVCETTASRILGRLYARTQNRHGDAPEADAGSAARRA